MYLEYMVTIFAVPNGRMGAYLETLWLRATPECIGVAHFLDALHHMITVPDMQQAHFRKTTTPPVA